MAYVFNPFTGTLDAVTDGNTVATYSTFSAFPASAVDGSLAVALDTDTLYVYNTSGNIWYPIGKPGDALSVGTYDSGSPSAAGLKIDASQAIIAQSASSSNPGMVNTTTQTFAGVKTFSSAPNLSSLTASQAVFTDGSKNLVSNAITGTGNVVMSASPTLTGTITAAAANFSGAISASNFSGSSSGTNTGDVTLAAFDSSPNNNGASLSGQVLTLQPADNTHPGGVSTTTQTFAGSKTFSSAPSFSAIVNTGTLTLPTSTDTLVARNTTDTLTNKTLTGNTAVNLISGSGTFVLNTTGTITAPNATDTLVGKATTDVLTNKSISAASSFIVDGSDNTKKIGFNISGFNTGVTLTLTATVGSSISLAFPSSLGSGDALVSNNTSATLINKKLGDSSTSIVNAIDTTKALAFSLGSMASATTLTITSAQSTTQSVAMPNVSSGDSIVTNNTSATLTNKTIAAGSNTISGLTNTNLSGSAAVTNANLAAMASSSSTVGTVKGNISGGSTTPSDLVLTSANTASSVVYRDASGNFSAGTITATLSGSSSGNLAKATGDIDLTTFTPANNQSAAANVTGLAFANATVRGAVVFYSVIISATSSLYEFGTLHLIQKGASWDMAQTSNGDDSLVVFTVTTAGQVQYTTPSYAGFSSAKMGFRALVTQV